VNLAAAVLTFREGLEAALIIAIVLTYLRRTGRMALAGQVWLGAGLAVALTAVFVVALQALGAEFEDPAEAIFEGFVSVLAVLMVTTMTFWMARQGRAIKGSLEHEVDEAAGAASVGARPEGGLMRRWGLAGVAFLAVGREGVETGLFLAAAAFASSEVETLVGGVIGLVIAVAVAWAVYVAGLRLNLRLFFRVSGVLLVFFGAAMLRHAIHEFEEVGFITPLVDHVWDTSAWLPDGEGAGAVLSALVGYSASPSLTQVLAYVAYFVAVVAALIRPWREEARGEASLPRAARAGA